MEPEIPEKGDLGYVRTTIRLPRLLHENLRSVALQAGQSAEALIQEGLRRLLPRISFDLGLKHPQEWGPELALRYVQFLPSPFVIKNQHASVIYANPAYEQEFKVPLNQLRGKSITDFAFTSWQRHQIAKDLREVVEDKNRKPKQFVETVTPLGGQMTAYRSIRYVFDAKLEKLVGDFSFAWTKFTDVKQFEELSIDALCQHVLDAPVYSGIESLFVPALDECPLSIAIKNAADMKIVWGNKVFVALAKKEDPQIDSVSDIIGKTSQEIWQLSDLHPVVSNDFEVQKKHKATYFEESLKEGKGFRTSLRFPIPGERSEVKFIGVISPHFLHTSYVSKDYEGEHLENSEDAV